MLKPQREGGGNNLYDDELRVALQTKPRSELATFILMERIDASVRPEAVFIRPTTPAPLVTPSTSELGIFSVSLVDARTREVFVSKPAGHLLRSKVASNKEGGLASGFGVMDSPFVMSESESES